MPSAPEPGAVPALELRHICKSFSGVAVLDDVSIAFRPGEIHALVGENGAGKSTVGKIAGGYYPATSGEILAFGRRVERWDPAVALEHGIAMMHQELQIVPSLTVAQNVFLGMEHNRFGLLRFDEAERLDEVSRKCGFALDADKLAGSFGIADQQKIEIMRALARNARLIVMDEPTSSLTEDEVQRLHQTMRAMRENGTTIIYVTHFLDHILDICDRATVLRDGRVVRTVEIAEASKASLIADMLGGGDGTIAFPALPPADRTQTPILEVRNLTSARGINDASLTIAPGEIVGLLGLVGSGRTEIAEAIYGSDASAGGDVMFRGEAYGKRSPIRSIHRGLVFVPEDRRGQGLVMTQDVGENMTLPYLKHFGWSGLIDRGRETSKAREMIDYFRISPKSARGDIRFYSGGNQQKVLLSKWILQNPAFVILDEPSRGVDVGARQQIHEAIVDLARRGTAVLLISSEIEEVLGMSHRAYLVHAGSTIAEVDCARTSVEEVVHRLFHATEETKTGRQADEQRH